MVSRKGGPFRGTGWFFLPIKFDVQTSRDKPLAALTSGWGESYNAPGGVPRLDDAPPLQELQHGSSGWGKSIHTS